MSRRHLLAVVLVGVTAAAVHLASRLEPYRWLKGDGAFYFTVAQGLIEDGSFEQRGKQAESWYTQDLGWNRNLDPAWSNIALAADGRRWLPKHPILLPLLALPLIHGLGPWGALLFNVGLWLCLPLLVFRIGSRIAPAWAAAIGAALFAAASFQGDSLYSFSNDVLYTALLLASFDAALGGRPALAGFSMGVSILAKFTNVLVAPALALFYLLRREGRSLLSAALAGAGPVLALLALNWAWFGGPLTTGYHRILVRRGGQMALHSHVDDFVWREWGPRLLHVLGEVASAFPPLLLVPVALGVLLWRRRFAEAALLALPIAVPLAFHAPYRYFRLPFVLGSLAVAAATVAGALAPAEVRAGPVPSPAARPMTAQRWARLQRRLVAGALAFVVVPLGVGFVRGLLPRRTLAERIRAAEVSLGTEPCDYFNPNLWGWECSGSDRGRAALITQAVYRHGRWWVRLSPHPSGRSRRITWADAHGTYRLRYRHDRGAPLLLRVRSGAQVLWEAPLAPGQADEATVTVPDGGAGLTLEVQGRRASELLVDGRLVARSGDGAP